MPEPPEPVDVDELGRWSDYGGFDQPSLFAQEAPPVGQDRTVPQSHAGPAANQPTKETEEMALSARDHVLVLSNSYHQIEIFGPMTEVAATRLAKRVEKLTAVDALVVFMKNPVDLKVQLEVKASMQQGAAT